MITNIKELFTKYKEAIAYIFFGVLTTAVDFVAYWLFTRLLHIDETLSNVLSQAVAILFAYVTNKIFVFEDKTDTFKLLIIQFAKFVSFRLVTLVLNTALFFLMHDICNINDIITKTSVSVIVIILNYVFSKLFVFKKGDKNESNI